MKKFSCIAIDDEPLALLVITQFCERFGNLDLSTFSEPRIGLEEIKRHKPDLVFLDIEMNSINQRTGNCYGQSGIDFYSWKEYFR